MIAVALVVCAGLLLVLQRALAVWTDKTAIFLSGIVIAFGLLVVVAWLLDIVWPPLWRIGKSAIVTAWSAAGRDRELSAWLDGHPRLARFLRARLTLERWTGWYLTATAVVALYFLIRFLALTRAVAIHSGPARYDQAVSALAIAFRTRGLTRVLWAATLAGDPWVLGLLTALSAALLLMWGRRRHAIVLVGAMVPGILLDTLIKDLLHRPRPPALGALIHVPGSGSFPSGHAFASLVFFGLLALIGVGLTRKFGRRLVIVGAAGLAAVIVAVSRVYLGVHWMTDILASWALGMMWLTLAAGAFLAWERYGPPPATARPLGDRRTRWSATGAAVVVAIAALIVAAQADPLLARVIAERPTSSPLAAVPTPLRVPAIAAGDIRRLPVFTEKLDGSPQEPISLIFVGTQQQLRQAFAAAGWSVADRPSFINLLHAAVSAIANQPYPKAPVTPSFLGGRVQDIAFEQPVGTPTIRRRRHDRWWLTSFTLDGRPVWVASASLDSRLEIGSAIPLPTHHIEPNIDAERDWEVSSLASTKLVQYIGLVHVTDPTSGTDAQGDRWFTGGMAAEIVWSGPHR
jgi:membrane-associated phospholipid phosphatase